MMMKFSQAVLTLLVLCSLRANCDPRLVCYFTIDSALHVEKFNASLCTHIILDLIRSYDGSSLTKQSSYSTEVVQSLRTKNPDLKILAGAAGTLTKT
jgi:hypothetical protein